MVAGEIQQEKGRDGVFLAQRWLESTTRVEAPWTVYEVPHLTTLTLLTGKEESWDIGGYFSESKNIFYAEVKNFSDSSSQGPKYREYLADCYSATARMLKDGTDKKWEFMWITWHPFLVETWTKLCGEESIREAVTEHFPEKLGDDEYDPDIGKLIADRLWLLVLSRRQEELMMSPKFLGHIRSFLTAQKGDVA